MHDSLYICRRLENAQDFVAWAKGQGFPTTVPAEDMHVTVLYSKTPTEWPEGRDDQLLVKSSEGRSVVPLGDGGAVVLTFISSVLQARHDQLIAAGATSDFPDYTPHVTISWEAEGVDLNSVEPYMGPLVFGPEELKPIVEDWKDNMTEKSFTKAQVVKVDESLGLVFGWAIVCKVDGEPYFDLQGDHIPEHSMLKATADFMVNSRVAKEMHNGGSKGVVLFSFPLTEDIAKAMGIVSEYTGWMVAMRPDDPSMLSKFRDGTYTGFSIGGSRIKDKDVG